MAARRLVILMLVVLAATTVLAALTAPRTEQPPSPEAREASGTAPRGGRLLEAAWRARAGRHQRLRARAGDQLALTIRSRSADQVEIPAFGLLEDVGPADPARFDVLLERPGRYAVRLAGAGREIGWIAVARGPRCGASQGYALRLSGCSRRAARSASTSTSR